MALLGDAGRCEVNNTLFTPGPWLLVQCDPQWIHALDDDGFNIFGCQLQGRAKHHEENNANGRLIRSAPDLYAALERLIAAYYGKDAIEQHSAITAAQVALAQARGEL